MWRKQWTRYAPDSGASGGGTSVTGGGTPPAQGGAPDNPPPDGGQVGDNAPRTWDTVLASLPEADRALYEAHTTGLRNTVQATRQERDALQQQLGELTKALGKNDPEAAKALLAQMTAELDTSRRRADFLEAAVRPEIGCSNPGAAFAIAQTQGLFDARGNPNWDAIKQAVPELFRKPIPAGNAGAGTASPPAGRATMNDFIRRASGRG
jgi:hypothetical protein